MCAWHMKDTCRRTSCAYPNALIPHSQPHVAAAQEACAYWLHGSNSTHPIPIDTCLVAGQQLVCHEVAAQRSLEQVSVLCRGLKQSSSTLLKESCASLSAGGLGPFDLPALAIVSCHLHH